MANIIVGTAGHIDHGKTTLIGALTGIETDKTQEEKIRGMSINLGFAYFDLPSGKRMGIVDVPGHEKFIKNMLAGVQGINMIMLVVDANEGIMPQTVEHASILNLLGINNYIIVITKCDTVDDEMIELVEEDIKDHFVGTPIEGAPVVKVDSVSRRGFDELIKILDEKASEIEKVKEGDIPRVNIDRVFSVKGFGTVVTGTLQDGVIKLNDELELYTSEIPVRVRNIQVHEQNVDKAYPGQRVAINLIGAKHTDISRGDVLTKKGVFDKSYMVDAKIKVLEEYDRAIELWTRVRAYIGTREVMARVVPVGCEFIAPGEEGFVQLRFEEEIVSKPNDKIILRNYSPMVTIGGGSILEPNAKKHRRFDDKVIKELTVREKNDIGEVILSVLENKADILMSIRKLTDESGFEQQEVENKLKELTDENKVICIAGNYASEVRLQDIKDEFIRIIKNYHQENPTKRGISREELKSRMRFTLQGKAYENIFEKFAGDECFVIDNSVVRLKDFEISYTAEQKEHIENAKDAFYLDGFSPRSISDISKDKDVQDLILSLVGSELVVVNQDIIMHREFYKRSYEILCEIVERNGQVTVVEFRDTLNTTRKYTLALLEHFDKLGITKRIEDYRVLTGKILKIK
ncbi:MAG: selenocysteine-specific translation elongation factor [Eubacteriales bacterium]|nr:selenocysteine-specific translation elongation factor [Eubacteriales bacterium]